MSDSHGISFSSSSHNLLTTPFISYMVGVRSNEVNWKMSHAMGRIVVKEKVVQLKLSPWQKLS